MAREVLVLLKLWISFAGGGRPQNGEKICILCPLFFFVFSVVEVTLLRFLLRQCIFATIVDYCYGRRGIFLFFIVDNR